MLARSVPCLLLALVVGCGVVKEQTPDAALAGDSSVDSDGSVDGIDAPPAPPARGRDLREGDGTRVMDFNGVARLPGGLVVAGSNRDMDGARRDGFLLRARVDSVDAAVLGGSLNDQLFAVAARDDRFAAVGITRSFRGTDMGNHALVVLGAIDGTLEIRRQRIAGDQAIEPRAISAHGTGWAVAGRHLDGQRFVVAILADTGDVLRAATFRLPGALPEVLTPRTIVSLGDRLVVVGDILSGTVYSAFFADLSATDLSPRAALRVQGATSAVLDDVTAHGDHLVAVGGVDETGYVLWLDRTTDAVVSDASLPVFQLAAVASTGPTLVAVADGGNALIAGTLDEAGLAGARHAQLRRPAFFGRNPLFVGESGGMFVGKVDATQVLREQPFNEAFEGQCGDTRLGEPVVLPAAGSNATVTVVALAAEVLTIATDTLTTASNVGTPAEQTLCP